MGFSNAVHLRPLKGTYLNITMTPLIVGFQMLVLGPGSLLHLEALGPLHVRCQDTLNWTSRGTYPNPGEYTAGGGTMFSSYVFAYHTRYMAGVDILNFIVMTECDGPGGC